MSTFILGLCILGGALYIIASFIFGYDYSETLAYRMRRLTSSDKKYSWLAISLATVTVYILQVLYGILWPLVVFKRTIALIASVNYITAISDYVSLMFNLIFSKDNP